VLEEGHHRSWRQRLLGKRRKEQEARVVVSHTTPLPPHSLLHPHGRQPRYRGNRTSTTKYSLLTFLPKALFEQYRCGTGLVRRACSSYVHPEV